MDRLNQQSASGSFQPSIGFIRRPATRGRRLIVETCGFSLLELLVDFGILTIILVVLLEVFMTSYQRISNNMGHDSSVGEALSGLVYLEHDIRNAYAIQPTYSTFTTGNNKIVLSLPSYNSSGAIAGSTDYIAYQVDNQNRLARSVFPAAGSLRKAETARPLASYVSSLALVYKAHDFMTGDGSTNTFTLSTNWLPGTSPVAMINGAGISGVTYNSTTLAATLTSAPASGSTVEFVYQVSPSSSTALSFASDVAITVNFQASGDPYSVALSGKARLRNK